MMNTLHRIRNSAASFHILLIRIYGMYLTIKPFNSKETNLYGAAYDKKLIRKPSLI
jgi:hypothetical protein